jgi:hypothetical protein
MSSNITLIDSRVTGYQTLIDNLPKPNEFFIIDAQSDCRVGKPCADCAHGFLGDLMCFEPVGAVLCCPPISVQ